MPLVSLNLAAALEGCPATRGMGTISLQYLMKELLPSASSLSITLSDNSSVEFLIHHDNEKTVLTSLNSLSSGCTDGVSLDFLPEILTKLNEKGVKFTALQFPHAFMVKGRVSSTVYRAHFNHLLIYKDSAEQLNASVIDSTMNPFGTSNPIPVLSWIMSTSILSGEELLSVKFQRLLLQKECIASLRELSSQPEVQKVILTNPIYTCKQPSIGDKRCSIYVLNAMVSLINYFTSEQEIQAKDIAAVVTEAHQALNEQEMMAISYPEASLGCK